MWNAGTRSVLYLCLLILVGLPGNLAAEGRRVLEFVPDKVQKAIQEHERRLGEYVPPEGEGHGFFYDSEKTWNPGATVRVAFRGGNQNLYQNIAEAAAGWTRYANIKFDFGSPGTYREWSLGDSDYAAEIRIGFDHIGYWSVLGTEALELEPGESSMNLEGFESALPDDWRAVVLHEFGHALGYHHEHQHPAGTCDKEFRWYDDPGYVRKKNEWGEFVENNGKRPGLYTVLEGAPNFWNQDKVDFNLKKLPFSHAYVLGAFDNKSIMKYFFSGWMFHDPTKSKCYSPTDNRELSQGDQEGAAKMYPTARAQMEEILEKRARFYERLLANPELPQDLKQSVSRQLESVRALRAASRQ